MVIPVKALGAAKSRLRSRAGDISGLALAFALDTVAAASECATVVVVTSDAVVAARMSMLGVVAVADPGAGLNAAVTAGVARADGPVAVLLGDLPALRSGELAEVLAWAAEVPLGVVPDREGSGTSVLTARDPRAMHPSFGAGSCARHEAAGHVVLPAGESVRADVDTEDDLRVAVALGVGDATAAALS